MTITVRVDESNNAPCHVGCLVADHYCNGYPHCIAGAFHKVKDWLTPGDVDRQVIREDRTRSAQGGYSLGRIVQGAEDGTMVEEIELHCRTLKFESLVRPNATPAPAAADPKDTGTSRRGRGIRPDHDRI